MGARERKGRGSGRRVHRWAAVAATILWGAVGGGALPARAALAPPVLHGRSAAVLSGSSGQLLWALHGHLRLPMASTTKLMTAVVALQLAHDQVDRAEVVPPQVRQAYGQLLGLRPGAVYTLGQLLEGMLLYSANDAAVAVAVDTAGSQRAFVRLMNREAQRLGLDNTHFANVDGLDDPDHYSSAIDLARLGWVALQNPVIRRVVAMRSALIPAGVGHGSQPVGNINSLLTLYPGAVGIKTGYTSEALNVVVGAARRGQQSVVAVVMGEPRASLWSDETALLNYGFLLLAAGAGVQARAAPSAPVVTARWLPAAGSQLPPMHGAAPPRPAPARGPAAWLLAASALGALLAARALGWRRRRAPRRRRGMVLAAVAPRRRRAFGSAFAAGLDRRGP